MTEGEAKQLAAKLARLFRVHTRVVLYRGRYVVRTSYDRSLLNGD